MADLFQTSKQNVGQHLKKIFEEGELSENSVVKNFFTTKAEEKGWEEMKRGGDVERIPASSLSLATCYMTLSLYPEL